MYHCRFEAKCKLGCSGPGLIMEEEEKAAVPPGWERARKEPCCLETDGSFCWLGKGLRVLQEHSSYDGAVLHCPLLRTNIRAVHKICSPLIALNYNNNVSGHFLSPPDRLFLPYITGCFVITTNDLSVPVLLTDSFPARCVQTCWNVKTQTVTQGDRLQWRNKSVQDTAGGHISCRHHVVVIILPIMSAVQFPVFEFALVLMMFTPGCRIWWSVTMLVLWKKDQSD